MAIHSLRHAGSAGNATEFNLRGAVALERQEASSRLKSPSRLAQLGAGILTTIEATRRSKFARRLAAICVATVITVPTAAYFAGRLFVKGSSDELSGQVVKLRQDVDAQVGIAIKNGGKQATRQINTSADAISTDWFRILGCNQDIPNADFRKTLREGLKCKELQDDLSSSGNEDTATAKPDNASAEQQVQGG